MQDTFLNIRQLMSQILQFKQDFPDKKVAFCFSGGGARGAYFGGVIEALQQAINNHPDQALLPIED
jgi:predicted acylesterase/phospholipase RssA